MSIKEGWKGRFLEDFEVGDVYRSRLGRTISEVDNTWFTMLTGNTNQIHFNADYAAKTEFGRPLVNSTFTLAVIAGLAVTDTSENGFALGWDGIKLKTPVYAGDTLYAETIVLAKRVSKSRPGQGILKVQTRGLNQRGDTVLEYARSIMVWSREAAPVGELFPEPKAPFMEFED